MVRVRIRHPNLRAVIADSARSKKIQMWPPFPERERSKAVWHTQLLAGLKKSLSVILPRLLVEVCREKPARFVRQEGIYANGFLAQEVVLDDGVGHREELPCLLVDFLPLLRAAFVNGLPVLYGRRHISRPAVVILPSPCVDIFSPAKQASKQRDSFSGTLLLVHRWRRLDGFGWRPILWRKLRNRNAVNRQEPPQASVFLPEANIFLLWRLEWKRFRTLLGHTAFTAPYDVSALLGDTPVRPQTPRRYQLGARILPPGLETGSANPLAAEPNPPANRVFLFSQTSDARRPGSSVYPGLLI